MAEASLSTPSREAQLCSMCRNIFARWDEVGKLPDIFEGWNARMKYLDWHKDPLVWMASANYGCVLCSCLLNSLRKDKADEMRQRILGGVKIEPRLRISHVYYGSDSDSEFQDSNRGNSAFQREHEALLNRERDERESDSEKEDGSDSDQWEDVSDSTDSDVMYEIVEIECLFYEIGEDGQGKIPPDSEEDDELQRCLAGLFPIQKDSVSSTRSTSSVASLSQESLTTKIRPSNIAIAGILSTASGSLEMAKRMVETCRTSHICGTWSSTPGKPPTRLIEIHKEGIRLCTPADVEEEVVEYVTLSHCWGEIDLFKLKSNNIASLHNSIPMERLCKTFQDAIMVTRTLGLRYLWIDSLCIIQDNEEDWRQESTRMAYVYGNAIVNIAATDAKDGSVGLFLDENTLRASRHYIQTNTSEMYELLETGLYDRCLGETYLSDRGWCFQERHLARRTLHFTKEQIFCECSQETACELWPKKLPRFIQSCAERHFSTLKYIRAEWFRAVSLYSTTQLTFRKDKLVAISGVARYIQDQNPDQYVAGLWRSGLERQLCWRVGTASGIIPLRYQTPAIQFTYRAPSWSWASLDQPVTWSFFSTEDITREKRGQSLVINVQNVELVLSGQDELGELQDAKLQVRCGPLMNPWDNKLWHDLKQSNRVYEGEMAEIYWDLRCEDRSTVEPLIFMPVLVEKGLQDPKIDLPIYGLIVTTAKDRGPGYFTRLGVWGFSFPLESYHRLMQQLSLRPDLLIDESLYQQVLEPDDNGIPQYTITLI